MSWSASHETQKVTVFWKLQVVKDRWEDFSDPDRKKTSLRLRNTIRTGRTISTIQRWHWVVIWSWVRKFIRTGNSSRLLDSWVLLPKDLLLLYGMSSLSLDGLCQLRRGLWWEQTGVTMKFRMSSWIQQVCCYFLFEFCVVTTLSVFCSMQWVIHVGLKRVFLIWLFFFFSRVRSINVCLSNYCCGCQLRFQDLDWCVRGPKFIKIRFILQSLTSRCLFYSAWSSRSVYHDQSCHTISPRLRRLTRSSVSTRKV